MRCRIVRQQEPQGKIEGYICICVCVPTWLRGDDPTKTLFCPWHGKVQTPQLRVHFSYPIRANEPLYIVYVGPKLTKR